MYQAPGGGAIHEPGHDRHGENGSEQLWVGGPASRITEDNRHSRYGLPTKTGVLCCSVNIAGSIPADFVWISDEDRLILSCTWMSPPLATQVLHQESIETHWIVHKRAHRNWAVSSHQVTVIIEYSTHNIGAIHVQTGGSSIDSYATFTTSVYQNETTIRSSAWEEATLLHQLQTPAFLQ